MNRNQLIFIAGILTLGAIAYAGYKIIKTNRAEKLAKQNANS